MGLFNPGNVGKAVQVQHSLSTSLQLFLEVRNGGSHLCCSSHEMGEGSQDVGVCKGKSSTASSFNKYYFYCLKFYGKNEGKIKN